MKEMTLDDTLCAASGTDGGRPPSAVPNRQNLLFNPALRFLVCLKLFKKNNFKGPILCKTNYRYSVAIYASSLSKHCGGKKHPLLLSLAPHFRKCVLKHSVLGTSPL